MDDPYTICLIDGCTNFSETHHEPLRSQLDKCDYWKERYNKELCRKHHTERHVMGYEEFCEKYPEYDGVSVTEYREEKRLPPG